MKNYCAWCHQADDHTCPELNTPQANQPKLACQQCHRPMKVIGITEAARLINLSRQTIYVWIEKGRVSVIHLASGRPLVCYSSLFLPEEEARKLNGTWDEWEDELEEESKPLRPVNSKALGIAAAGSTSNSAAARAGR